MRSILTSIFNYTWEKALLDIKEKTPENSIINAWWPPGHFIKAIAHRRVNFDGATINFPQSYWTASIFLNADEVEDLGILRMLNNSANQAAEYLTTLGYPTSKTVEILKQITKLNRQESAKILKEYIKDDSRINHLLDLTHKTPPPSYLFIYSEFVDNNIELPFVAHWNFKAIEKINKSPELLKDVPRSSTKDYLSFLWDLAGGSYRYSGPLSVIGQNGSTILFDNNVSVNTLTKECFINSQMFGKGIPKSIFYLENNSVHEKEFPEANLSYSVMLISPSPNEYNCILLDRPLAQSLLMRLYFYDGAGLSFIKPVINESDLTKRTVIKVFEINWDGFKKKIGDVNN